MAPVATIRWDAERLYIIDQTLLPLEESIIELNTVEEVWEAIKSLRVRGAPAIGVCAAYGVLVGVRPLKDSDSKVLRERAIQCIAYLATSRPTAVNLFYALDRMQEVLDNPAAAGSAGDLFKALESEAAKQFMEDMAMCRAIGECGAELIQVDAGILTHCNAGGLATTGYGTALAPMYVAHEQGRRFRVFADETRPLLQGARLTAWELCKAGIDVTVLCDNMAAVLMREGRINMVIVGADRIAANGDAANKIGTYGVAALARLHGIPFYIAAPSSTFDRKTPAGVDIPIEERDPKEIREIGALGLTPPLVSVFNPAFDVTPAEMITAFITDKGILKPPFDRAIEQVM